LASAPIVIASRYSYPETIDRLTKAISAAGSLIFTLIDQADAARAAGLDLRPTSLLIFGNPKGGTPLMESYPLAGLLLPLKLLVWEENGATHVAHAHMAAIMADAGVPAHDPRVAAMDRALELLSQSVR
jgi:uncharacterized protein (DUF302 family)